MRHQTVALLGEALPLGIDVHLRAHLLGDFACAVLAAAVDHHHLVGKGGALDAAADPVRQKLRSPQELAAATLRLVGLRPNDPRYEKLARKMPNALAAMGQPPFKALRPDGWPEVAEGWMTPPMVAARVDWAVDLARQSGDRVSPAEMAKTALGDYASPLLVQSVSRAEQRWEGLAVLLGSPEFSRR